MTEVADALVAGVKALLHALPTGNSALLQPLVKLLLSPLGASRSWELFLPDLSPHLTRNTLEKYLRPSTPVKNLELLSVARVAPVEGAVSPSLVSRELELVEYLQQEYGRTQSGRLEHVLHTQLTLPEMYARYCQRCEAAGAPPFSAGVFERVVKQAHVHHEENVGADTMSCFKCILWPQIIDGFGALIQTADSPQIRQILISRQQRFQESLHIHEADKRDCFGQFKADKAAAEANSDFVLVCVDFSTINEVQGRGKFRIANASVGRAEQGHVAGLVWRYFDFVRPQVGKSLFNRKFDMLYFMLSALLANDYLQGARTIVVYSDATTKEFRSLGALLGLSRIQQMYPAIRFRSSFFPPYHGAGPSDRHFGTVKTSLRSAIRRDGKENFVNEEKAIAIIRSLKNTVVFDLLRTQLFHFATRHSTTASGRGVTRFFSFGPIVNKFGAFLAGRHMQDTNYEFLQITGHVVVAERSTEPRKRKQQDPTPKTKKRVHRT